MKTRAIITCPCDDILISRLHDSDIDTLLMPDITHDELMEIISDFEILVISTSIRVDQSLLDRATSLRIIGRLGSGLDHVDQEAVSAAGVKLLSTPAANARAVAEHVLGMIIGYNKHIPRAEFEVKEGVWRREENRGTEIEDKKIGIIGYGHNGSLTAKMMNSLGMQVSVYDPYVRVDDTRLRQCNSLEELMSDLDYLSFHVQLTDETYHYLDTPLIRMASRPFVLINISRGEVVNTSALLDAIEQGDIFAALLDVIENEKSQTSGGHWTPEDIVQQELMKNPNVYITPHIAGYSVEAKYKMSAQLADLIIAET